MSPLTAAALALLLCTNAALFTDRIALYQAFGCWAVALSLQGVHLVRIGAYPNACFNSLLCALALRGWWRGGGGDDTRRRLRRLRRAFRGIRRTAPTSV